MPGPILNPQVIRFDLYSLPVVIVGVATLLLATFVLVREQGSRVGRRYFAFAASVALYVAGAGVSYAVTNPALSLAWDRVAHLGVVFIPTTLWGASVAVLGRLGRNRGVLAALLGLSVVCAVLVVFTDLFIAGNRRVFWGWYPVYGPAGYVFVAVFAAVTLAALGLHVSHLRRSSDTVHRRRTGATIAAIAIGLLGGIDFLPAIGVNIYAFGFLPISLFVLVLGYVLVRYRLVDITPEIAAVSILNTMQGALIVTDRAGVVRVANPLAHDWLGVERGGLIDQELSRILRDRAVPDSERDGHYVVTDGSGTSRHVEVAVSRLTLPGGETVGNVYAAHDISAFVEAGAELARRALHDSLTGLPNRSLLYERIGHSIRLARRTGELIAVLFIDLDHFKEVNDTHGHDAGDTVLIAVAERLLAIVRESDTVARMGGDEFIVVSYGVRSRADAELIAVKVRASIERGIVLPAGEVRVGSSVGLAMYPGDGDGAEALISCADRAMYRAKHASPE